MPIVTENYVYSAFVVQWSVNVNVMQYKNVSVNGFVQIYCVLAGFLPSYSVIERGIQIFD